MEHLSAELIQLVAEQLDFNDFHRCLRVNKYWYAIFIRLLYAVIKPKSKYHLKLFLESTTIYSRCMEAGNFVKHLDMSYLSSADKFNIRFENGVDFIDALLFYPNIEHLSVDYKVDIIQALMNPRLPGMNKLQVLHLYPWSYDIDFKYNIMDCYYKYRSQLTCMKLDSLTSIISAYTPDSFITYLESFPHLKSLYIEIPLDTFEDSPMLNNILSHCPTLTRMQYACDSLNTLNCGSEIDIKYRLIRQLDITVNSLYLQDVFYIKNSFTYLDHLTLNAFGTVDDECVVITELMQIEALRNLRLQIPRYSESIMNTFWKHACFLSHYLQEHAITKASFTLNNSAYGSSILSFSKCPFTGIRTIKSNLSVQRHAAISYELYLKEIGHRLDELKIEDRYYGSSITIERTNEMCPVLSKLSLFGHKLTKSNRVARPNHNLHNLTLYQCTFSLAIFREMEQAYPMLRRLTLSVASISSDHNYAAGKIYQLQLPETGLISLAIFSYDELSNILVVKEVDGVSIRSWHYNHESEGMVVTEHRDIFLVKQILSVNPLFLFKSTTVESVCIT
ncbi:hypothetical protein BDB01DRAFT_810067, partial [Pilobolus umbonatus]